MNEVSKSVCPNCKGTGVVLVTPTTLLISAPQYHVVCPVCHGTGIKPEQDAVEVINGIICLYSELNRADDAAKEIIAELKTLGWKPPEPVDTCNSCGRPLVVPQKLDYVEIEGKKYHVGCYKE